MISTATAFIKPDWPAPANIFAGTTTRFGGVSSAPYAEFNLAMHIDDQKEDVLENRLRLQKMLNLPAEPTWLQQVHGADVILADAEQTGVAPHADAAISLHPGKVCVVLTADCLPVLLCNRQGSKVAAVHAGWRGLAQGILRKTLAKLAEPGDEMLAWFGPAIGGEVYEVGDEVRQSCLEQTPSASSAFKRSPAGRWFADLYTIARIQLNELGCEQIFGGDLCTLSDDRFYSYRSEGETGRQASLIWRQ